MNKIKSSLKVFFGFAVLAAALFVFFEFYPYLFAKNIKGVISKVERVDVNVSLLQNNSDTSKLSPQLFSFAVAIKTADGEIFTASAEDRQWAAVSEGLCVTAKFFPYPPWKLDKAGTYYGARLLESRVCQ